MSHQDGSNRQGGGGGGDHNIVFCQEIKRNVFQFNYPQYTLLPGG